MHIHPDAPQDGETWMRKGASFTRVKVTNNMTNKNEFVSWAPQFFARASSLASPRLDLCAARRARASTPYEAACRRRLDRHLMRIIALVASAAARVLARARAPLVETR